MRWGVNIVPFVKGGCFSGRTLCVDILWLRGELWLKLCWLFLAVGATHSFSISGWWEFPFQPFLAARGTHDKVTHAPWVLGIRFPKRFFNDCYTSLTATIFLFASFTNNSYKAPECETTKHSRMDLRVKMESQKDRIKKRQDYWSGRSPQISPIVPISKSTSNVRNNFQSYLNHDYFAFISLYAAELCPS